MSGTRKLEKFELERPTISGSGTRKLEKFELPPESLRDSRPEIDAKPDAPPLPDTGPRARMPSISTPVAEIPLATLAAARKSVLPDEPFETVQVQPDVLRATEDDDEAKPDSEPRISQAPRSIDREPGVEKLRTRIARKFTTLADEVTESFGDFYIGAGAWGVELTAPEGMSTGGGKQALQHLRLRPKRRGHPVLVGGLVDAVAKTAELRDYEYMTMLHRARFDSALEITYDEWEQFLRLTEVVLRAEQISPVRVPPPRELRMPVKKGGVPFISRIVSRNTALVALGIVVPLALFVVVRVLMVLFK
jgi:hypothetical protein